MFKVILKISGWILLFVFLGFTVAFTTKETKYLRCSLIDVQYEGTPAISLGAGEIIDLVKSADRNLEFGNFYEINAENIERMLRQNKTIEKAEVYKSIIPKGNKYAAVLTVAVKHRTPVMRIMTPDADYYLDKLKEDIPVSIKYPMDVIVATGKIDKEFASGKLLEFGEYIGKDKFWKAQIEQIDIQENGEVVLIPLVGNHRIEFGTLENFEEKLANLKVFYEKVLVQDNWDKYKIIVLKYKNQVIGTKS
jgi:cell division protein FtsQ